MKHKAYVGLMKFIIQQALRRGCLSRSSDDRLEFYLGSTLLRIFIYNLSYETIKFEVNYPECEPKDQVITATLQRADNNYASKYVLLAPTDSFHIPPDLEIRSLEYYNTINLFDHGVVAQ